ncbi:MAG: glycosyltransferase family 2 protein [Solirubrobacterales bacterium]
MGSAAKLTAIVPATDAPPTLERCLEAIRSSARPPDELIVVTEPSGAGPARARNEGAERASGDVLVFVDSDVLVHDDALLRVAAAFDAGPDLVAIFGSYDDSPEASGAVSGFRNLLHHHVHQQGAGPAQSFWAGIGAIRADAFSGVGGFDAERYPRPSIEDIELGSRLAAAGARIELDPGLQGTHLKRWTLTSIVRTDFADRGVPWVELIAAGGAPAGLLNLGWRHRLSALLSLACVVQTIRRRPLPVLAALAGLVALNRDLYALVLARRGPAQAIAGIGVHIVHHLTSAAALAAGLTRGSRTSARSRRARAG